MTCWSFVRDNHATTLWTLLELSFISPFIVSDSSEFRQHYIRLLVQWLFYRLVMQRNEAGYGLVHAVRTNRWHFYGLNLNFCYNKLHLLLLGCVIVQTPAFGSLFSCVWWKFFFSMEVLCAMLIICHLISLCSQLAANQALRFLSRMWASTKKANISAKTHKMRWGALNIAQICHLKIDSQFEHSINPTANLATHSPNCVYR